MRKILVLVVAVFVVVVAGVQAAEPDDTKAVAVAKQAAALDAMMTAQGTSVDLDLEIAFWYAEYGNQYQSLTAYQRETCELAFSAAASKRTEGESDYNTSWYRKDSGDGFYMTGTGYQHDGNNGAALQCYQSAVSEFNSSILWAGFANTDFLNGLDALQPAIEILCQ